MENLGTLADQTSGIVDIVDPLDLAKVKINKQILATNVSCTVHLNKGLFFPSGQNHITQDFGNVMDDTDLVFSFGPREFFTTTKELYFQAQITYTKMDGTKFLRVVTKTMPITHSREQAESALNAAIIGLRAVRESAAIAQQVLEAQR